MRTHVQPCMDATKYVRVCAHIQERAFITRRMEEKVVQLTAKYRQLTEIDDDEEILENVRSIRASTFSRSVAILALPEIADQDADLAGC